MMVVAERLKTLKEEQRFSVKEQELEDCLAVVACVIDQHGEDDWLIYKLYEEELDRLRSYKRKSNKALSCIFSISYNI